jgi:hypothetical protein
MCLGMIGLAMALWHRFKEAEPMHCQRLAICQKVLRHEHSDTLMRMNNLV